MMKTWKSVCSAIAVTACVAAMMTSQADEPIVLEQDWSVFGDMAFSELGRSVSSAGDVNGDGIDDVIIGAPYWENKGRAYLYYGSAMGLLSKAAWTTEGKKEEWELGWPVCTAGDVNGDGYDDVIVSAAWYDNAYEQAGIVMVYHGSAAGLSSTTNWTVEGARTYALLGGGAAGGDVNGDGYDDVIVSAAGGPSSANRTYAYYGSPSGLASTPAWSVGSTQRGVSAGDVNGDGYDDVILLDVTYESFVGRAYVHHGSESGLSPGPAWSVEGVPGLPPDLVQLARVASAGDVNGDGYSDVLVSGSGRVFAYYGSPTGLSTAPSWTVQAEQDGAELGWGIAPAGDFNGDGYGDVIVGQPHMERGEDRMYVYPGSPTGLSTTPGWTAVCGQTWSYFGYSVALAGDVNGDGVSDVVVGSLSYDHDFINSGAAFAYYGIAPEPSGAGPTWRVYD